MNNKVGLITVLVFSLFMNTCYSSVDNYPKVDIDILSDNLFLITCENQHKEFHKSDIRALNDFTCKYFTIGNITSANGSNSKDNTIIFYDFSSNNSIINNYKLILSDYSNCYKNIVLNYNTNDLNIPRIIPDDIIKRVEIKSAFKIPNPCELDDIEMDNIYLNNILLEYYPNVNIIFNEDTLPILWRRVCNNMSSLKSAMKWRLSNRLKNYIPNCRIHKNYSRENNTKQKNE